MSRLIPEVKKILADRFGENIRFDEPMAAYTSIRVGGPADALVAPRNTGDLLFLMKHLTAAEVPWFVFGGGSNLLIRDKGIRGVVISMAGFTTIENETESKAGVTVRAEAGAKLSAVCRHAIENGLSGMAFAMGIPGTIGGAVMMNAGTAAGEMESVLSSVTMLFPPDRTITLKKEDLFFSYRGLASVSPEAGDGSGAPGLIIEARFDLVPSDRQQVSREADDALSRRRRWQPAGLSAGCFFKNPAPGVSAGELIDRAGLKGLQIGGAAVSEQHANFIINRDRATAEDILAVVRRIQETVLTVHNVFLEPEVKIVGEE